MEEYRILFDKFVAPLPHSPKEVLEETFMNGLSPWIKAKAECWEPDGFAQMMKLAQSAENREMTRREADHKKSTEGKAQTILPFNKTNIPSNTNEIKVGGNFPIRTICEMRRRCKTSVKVQRRD